MNSSRQINKRAIEWLVRLNSPDLAPEQHQEFFDWLERSEKHQFAFIKAEQAWQSGLVAAEISSQSINNRRYYRIPFATAAVLLCVITIWCLFLNTRSGYLLNSYIAASDSQIEERLSDGSVVVLHKNTELMFSFGRDFRVAKLTQGEAYFNVVKDTERPFYVVMNNGSVRVLGTQFTVRRIGSDSQITVLEGSVSLIDTVEPMTTEFNQKPLLVLVGNQQIQFSDALEGKSPDSVNAQIEMAWKDGRVVLNGLPLRDVIEKINRHFNTPIVIKQKSLGEKEITGVISLRDPLKAANTLARISGATVSQNKADNNIELWIKVSE